MKKTSKRKTKTSEGMDLLRRAMENIHAITNAREVRIRNNELPQEEKISHALVELLRDEVADESPLDEYQAALDFVVFAWNISLMEDKKQHAAIQKIIPSSGGIDEEMRRNAVGQIKRLIIKKQNMFPNDKRQVVSWESGFRGNEFHITAVALHKEP